MAGDGPSTCGSGVDFGTVCPSPPTCGDSLQSTAMLTCLRQSLYEAILAQIGLAVKAPAALPTLPLLLMRWAATSCNESVLLLRVHSRVLRPPAGSDDLLLRPTQLGIVQLNRAPSAGMFVLPLVDPEKVTRR